MQTPKIGIMGKGTKTNKNPHINNQGTELLSKINMIRISIIGWSLGRQSNFIYVSSDFLSQNVV